MKLRIISPAGPWPNEIKTVLDLLDAGLAHYHCRKPGMDREEYRAYLEAFPAQCRPYLVYHSSEAELAEALGFQQIHNPLLSPTQPEIIYSKSCHSMAEFNQAQAYETAFLSPIFDSISKQNYPAMKNLTQELASRSNHQSQLCALGGVQKENLTQLHTWGFDAAALMGAIWQEENPIKYFKSCLQIAHSF